MMGVRLSIQGLARWRSILALPILLVAAGSTCLAQDIIIVDEVEEAVVNQNVFELHESNFEIWVYGNVNRSGSTRDQLDSLLSLYVEEVQRSCDLSEAQKKKLLLAGHGDIKHFQDRVAEARRTFEKFRHDQNNMNVIFQETQPLAAKLRAGLFGDDSFFAKALGRTLAPDQAAKFKEAINEKNRFRYRAKVALAVSNLDNIVGFTGEQRRRLIDLTLETTTPIAKAGNQYEQQIVLLKMSRIPEDKLRPIFDDARWKVLKQQLTQARGMEQFLKNNGLIDDEKLAAGFEPTPIKND